jgi:hypothetical protein
MARTIDELLDPALTALGDLGRLGEEVADEWQYVVDLEATWRDRLAEVAATRRGQPVDEAQAAAIERVIAETRLISDPHRAIDWLSTFPQVVLLALAEPA